MVCISFKFCKCIRCHTGIRAYEGCEGFEKFHVNEANDVFRFNFAPMSHKMMKFENASVRSTRTIIRDRNLTF